MTYKVEIAARAKSEMLQFAAYAAAYSDDFAREQFTRLNRILTIDLAESPTTWAYFHVTGAPYRAYLFNAGRRTSFWIVYTIDEAAKTVDVLRFWNASRDPDAFKA